MTLNEIITSNITIVIGIIILAIAACLVATFLLLKITQAKYDDLVIQNNKLNEQVRTYSNNLARLYEQERFIDSEQEPDVQHISAPDVNDINVLPSMEQPVESVAEDSSKVNNDTNNDTNINTEN